MELFGDLMAKADEVGKALKDLRVHHKASAPFDMRKAFAMNAKRFAEFSAHQDDLLLDYSKCAVTPKTIKLLLSLATAADVAKKRDAMFAGEIINTTEGRAVLHTALRNQSAAPGDRSRRTGRPLAPTTACTLLVSLPRERPICCSRFPAMQAPCWCTPTIDVSITCSALS